VDYHGRPQIGVHSTQNQYSTTSARPDLSVEVVVHKFLPFLPFEAQQAIVGYLDRKTPLIARQITQIDQLDDLLQQQRKAILLEAVTGKIDLSAAPLP
jgi:restriction endonuclease S subunit